MIFIVFDRRRYKRGLNADINKGCRIADCCEIIGPRTGQHDKDNTFEAAEDRGVYKDG